MAWFRRFVLDLSEAGEFDVPAGGHALLFRRASGIDIDVVATLTLDNQPESFPLRYGEGWRFGPWSSLALSWKAMGADHWAEFLVWGSMQSVGQRAPEVFISPITPDLVTWGSY